MPNGVLLRDVTASDLPIFFEQQLDPAANHMAAFTAKDPADRDAFEAHWTKIRGDDSVIIKTVIFQGHVAGHVASFQRCGDLEVTYWIGKQYWGQGIATQALAEFLQLQGTRPICARAANDNIASIRVLEKCGFTSCGHGKGFANARSQEVQETIFKLVDPGWPGSTLDET